MRATLTLIAWAVAEAASVAQGSGQEKPWNVLWLTVEDMSPWIACYGDDTVPTPNLDRLAEDSVRFVNAFATSPVCAPARSSLITGMYATRIGTMHMRNGKPSAAAVAKDPDAYAEIPGYEGVPPEFVRCFPEHLRAAGYYCTNNAKTDYQFRAPATTWDVSGGKAHWKHRAEDQPFFAVFNHTGTHESKAFPEEKRRPELVTPEDVPVPPLYPDTPAVRDAMARTYNNIAAMDVWVGKKLAELERAGLLDSTVIFFFSDHGVGLPRGKRSPYDLGTRVPLLVRFPDGSRAGTVDERVASFVDLGPTVLSLAGLQPDERLDGTPLLGPHARERGGYAYTHADRFDSVYDRARSVTDGRFRLVRNEDVEIPHLVANVYRERLGITLDLYALRATDAEHPTRWQVASTRRPAIELYDSRTDPWEVANLAADPAHAEKLAELSAALDAWIADTGDLGLVLPESAMVAEHLWPDLEQPVTASPSARVASGTITLASETPGASIGWRDNVEGPWRVYTGPFVTDAESIEVLAHRIGYAPATARVEL